MTDSHSAVGPVVPVEAGRRRAGGTRARRARLRNPSRADLGSWRGLLWTAVVAANFYLMSYPRVFIDIMDDSVSLAVLVTVTAVVVSSPWIRTPRVSLAVLAFLGWALLSSTWSILPVYTLEAWAQVAFVTAVAVMISANVSARVLVAGFVLGGVVVSLASIYAFYERLPNAYYSTAFGYWMAGVGTNSNILAYSLILSLCALCAALPRRWWGRGLWASSVILIGYTLHEAHSSTGALGAFVLVAATVLLVGWGPVTRRFVRSRRHRVIAGAVLVAVAVGAYLAITKVFEQDLLTFSNRSQLWAAIISTSQDRPMGGFGWGAVWNHPWKPALLNVVLGSIWDESGLALPHGHNSVFDLLIEVGIIGVALWALVMVTAGIRAVALLRAPGPAGSDDAVRGRFVALVLVALVVFGITEPMSTIPLGWWTLVLLTEPVVRGRTMRDFAGYLGMGKKRSWN